MQPVPWSKAALVLFVACVLGLALWIAFGYRDHVGRSTLPAPPSRQALSIQGLEYTTYESGRLLSRIAAAELTVKSRKFSVFRVKSVNEAVLTDTRFELFSPDPNPAQAAGGEDRPGAKDLALGRQLAKGVEGLAGLKGMGKITRATFAGMRMTVYGRGGGPELRIMARQAFMEPGKPEVRMEKVFLENLPLKTRLISDEVIWNEERETFAIPGTYRLETADSLTRGTAGLFDLSLRPIVEAGSGRLSK
jgi:hypothetical protein